MAIDASGLNVDQEVDLEAIDETGAPVPGVEIIPQRVHVRIDVARELAYATLPVVPVLTGAPARWLPGDGCARRSPRRSP